MLHREIMPFDSKLKELSRDLCKRSTLSEVLFRRNQKQHPPNPPQGGN